MRRYGIENIFYTANETKVSFNSIDLNNSLNGYLMLAKLELMHGGRPLQVFINLKNKFDTVSNGKHLTGYHFIKQKQLNNMRNDTKIVDFDCMELSD